MQLIMRATSGLVAALGMVGLAACDAPATTPAPSPKAVEAAPPATKGATISNARLVLAPVRGNPAALYFDLSYAGSPAVTLDDVDVEGAGMAMIHQMIDKGGAMSMGDAGIITLKDGDSISFAPGGLHVMVMEPAESWQPGGTAKVTLMFSGGMTAAVEVPVRAAGDER
ncbi:hypothetical protein BG023_111931 [Porphyrobacter sp. LM 6]|nr:hypothetical protein BG023_111931 [Porphyrobacter sp. LM 6]